MLKKIKMVLFFMTVLVVSQSSLAERISRIIGGTTADRIEWPWMAGLVYNSSNNDEVFCGASLIAEHWVLTAAHCVIDLNKRSFQVIVNHALLFTTGTDTESHFRVESIILHPAYNNLTLDNDLALLKLSSSPQITPIKVLSPFTFQGDKDQIALALGWGNTSTTAEIFPDSLRQVSLSLVDNPTCGSVMMGLTDEMLCAGAIGKDTCQGDSGGPLIIFDTEANTWRQAGITSWGGECAAPNNFGVYTRVSSYADYISTIICSATETPQAPKLILERENTQVSIRWDADDNISGYRLNYADYPKAEHLHSIDLNKLTHYSINLPVGSAFYVAITAYKNNCLSHYSNIEHFVIP